MPWRDGTGPAGSGPATGWGRGNCNTTGNSGFFGGRGRGRGLGFKGFGPANWFSGYDSKQELSYLENIQRSIGEQINKLRESLTEK